MRESRLDIDDYLDRFYDDGNERSCKVGEDQNERSQKIAQRKILQF